MDMQKIYEISKGIVENTNELLMGEINLNCSSGDIDKFAMIGAVSVGLLFHNLRYISEKKGISVSELYAALDLEGKIKEFEEDN